MNQDVNSPYEFDCRAAPRWQVGIVMSDGTIAVNPDSPLFGEAEALRVAQIQHDAKPFIRYAIVAALQGNG